MKLRKIISGGQTGADQAGLDAGVALRLETGGTAPAGFVTERGPAVAYMQSMGLVDTGLDYKGRTRRNVRDSGATVVFGDVLSAGSAQTIRMANDSKKPVLVNPSSNELIEFLELTGVEVLNVAGNRASKDQFLYPRAYRTIIDAVKGVRERDGLG